MTTRNKGSFSQDVRRELVRFQLLDDAGWLGGVCAAIAYRLAVPAWIVRLAWFLTTWFYGVGLFAYLVIWFFVPNAEKTPSDYEKRTGDRR